MKFTLEQIAAATAGEISARGRNSMEGVSTDSRKIGAGELFVPIRGENFDGHDFIAAALEKGAGGFLYEASIVKRDAANELAKKHGASAVAVKDSLYALGELARSARERFPRLPIVAVTGSSGKSTTKEMAASIISRTNRVLKNEGNLNNRIGLPITLFLLDENVEVAVVEMGTNEPGEIGRLARIARPQVACVTNVGPVHLEGLGTIEGVAGEKGALPRALKENDAFAVNADDPNVLDMARNTPARLIAYGLGKPPQIKHSEFVTAKDVQKHLDRSRFTLVTGLGEKVVDLPVPGTHNVINAVAASAIARALDKNMDDMAAGLESHRQLKWRTQVHRLDGDVTVFEDCYNSNPISAAAALDLLTQEPGRTVAVLGEMRELGDAADFEHERLGRHAASRGVDVLIALGDHSKKILEGFDNEKKKGVGFRVESVEEAAVRVLDTLGRGDRVLLKASRSINLENAFPVIKERWKG